MTTTAGEPPPFLDEEPPPWAARALATVLIVLFMTALVALFVVQVPETVSASFVLEPLRGADPVRALHPGIVSTVNVTEAQSVAEKDVLFVLTSELVGDRVSERQAVATRLSGERGRLNNERMKYENEQRADEQERLRLEQRLVTLQRQAEVKEQQLALTKEISTQRQREYKEGLLSLLDANRAKLEVEQLAGELERVRTEIVDSRNEMARLTYQMESRRAAFTEIERTIAEEMTTARGRKSVLDRDTLREGNALSIEAPCNGTIVKLHVRQPGAIVDESDLMAELVCAGEPLQAELMVPERGIALVRVGQSVKLLYDAFPYERYGVQYGTLTWLSPASTAGPRGASFRAFAELGSDAVGVQGRPRAVLPGMTGRAAVVVGRRSLASYALEPLRQMRESLSAGPIAAENATAPSR
jgi:membrane fusion protein